MLKKELTDTIQRMRAGGMLFREIACELRMGVTAARYWAAPEKSREYHRGFKAAERERDRPAYNQKIKAYRNGQSGLMGKVKRALYQSKTKAIATGKNWLPCLTPAEDVAAAYDGVCACCGRVDTDCYRGLHMDHCSKTGCFRGWLCFPCNAMLGQAADNPETLRRGIEYLTKG